MIFFWFALAVVFLIVVLMTFTFSFIFIIIGAVIISLLLTLDMIAASDFLYQLAIILFFCVLSFLFFYRSFKKSKENSDVMFIDASKECVKVTNNNKLTQENIQNIIDVYTNREDKEYVGRVVSSKEIAEEDYNLSVSTYVEPEDIRAVIDIVELNAKIKEIVAKEDVLRKQIDDIIAEIEG